MSGLRRILVASFRVGENPCWFSLIKMTMTSCVHPCCRIPHSKYNSRFGLSYMTIMWFVLQAS